MRIINLVENTEGAAGCGSEHGLCFYIETEHHKLLMDTGASGLLLHNAQKLGVNLAEVDAVVLSHGHYDHGGGILPFVWTNSEANIYVQETAFAEYYSMRDGSPRYIGLAKEIRELSALVIVGAAQEPAAKDNPEPGEAAAAAHKTGAAQNPYFRGVLPQKGIYRIDDEISIFDGIGNARPVPSANRTLKIKSKGELIQDDFRHEQCLVISTEGKKVLFSGCAHHGILNILARYAELYGGEPDVVVSGFHMMKKSYTDEDRRLIVETANELRNYRTVFFTGHCTGEEPYKVMKEIMGDQLHYVHSGDEIQSESGGQSP